MIASTTRNIRRVTFCLLVVSALFIFSSRFMGHPLAQEDAGVEQEEVVNQPRELTQAEQQTAILFAKSFLAEVGWHGKDEHVAIAHVLKKRSDRLDVPINKMIKSYVAMFDKRTAKVRWMKELSIHATQPRHWPRELLWSEHVGKWQELIRTAQAFVRGELEDTCPKAFHWGGSMDPPKPNMRKVKCLVPTKNTFYRIAGQ